MAGYRQPGEVDIDSLRAQLAGLRSRYTEEHPDIQGLRSRIARLEARMAEEAPATSTEIADSTTVIAREQLLRATAEVKKLEQRYGDLERRIAEVRARVEDTPRTEQELATLTRDYNKLNDNYTALLTKQLEAQMAGRLERRWKGDQFRMLDPAHLPEKPYFPKPWLVLGLGVALGLLVGLALSLAAEFLDPTVKDQESLEGLLEYPVLARIPHLPDLSAGIR
jgi:uncharacterized protein involved in exopolysaccharide biosynthesis